MRSYLFRMIFTFTFFLTYYAINAQLCVECPFNNCSYCWGYGGGGSGGGDEQIENPGGGGPAFCNYHIAISGGAYAGVSINNGSCSEYVTLDPNPYDNSGSYSIFCRIHSS